MSALAFSKATRWDPNICSYDGCVARAKHTIIIFDHPTDLMTCFKHRRKYEEIYASALEQVEEEQAA